jgi:selenocysteine lyase/cysteine desulfurase
MVLPNLEGPTLQLPEKQLRSNVRFYWTTSIRLAPHVYNDKVEIDRLFEVLPQYM